MKDDNVSNYHKQGLMSDLSQIAMVQELQRRINKCIKDEGIGVNPLRTDMIDAIVKHVAPGWEYNVSYIVGDVHPKVHLTQRNANGY